MNLNHWLITALRDLDPQSRARLEAEYTAHFREALDTTQGEAQALATLGDAAELNEQLKRQYLTIDEGVWLDKYADQMAHPPHWSWLVIAGFLLLSYLAHSVQPQFWLTVLVIAVIVALHPLLLRFCSRRRAALTLATVIVPALFTAAFGLSYQDHWSQLTVMVIITAYVYIPRRHIWFKALRRG